MPVYEYYCCDCHAVFSFLSRRVDILTRPACPECDRLELARHLSVFSAPKHAAAHTESESELSDAVSRELSSVDNDDPQDVARVMDSLYRAGGRAPGEAMGEALDRMRAGEDPERIEADLGAAIDLDETWADLKPNSGAATEAHVPQKVPPRVVSGLYELKHD